MSCSVIPKSSSAHWYYEEALFNKTELNCYEKNVLYDLFDLALINNPIISAKFDLIVQLWYTLVRYIFYIEHIKLAL